MTVKDLEKALDVLLWLFEEPDIDGALRDEISHVRQALYEQLDDRS